MQIVHKHKWGFWIFKRYAFIMKKTDETLVELFVPQSIWLRFDVGDYYDIHYHQFYKYDQKNF